MLVTMKMISFYFLFFSYVPGSYFQTGYMNLFILKSAYTVDQHIIANK